MHEKVDLPSEIERYYQKWKRDPQSRIFAQLADAYRKSGMLDEAIEICLEGLKVHPSYGSARMVLARAYQEKGQDMGAERELLEIIKNDPNNLLANRLLGDLLYKGGRIQEAIERYQAVLKLTPLDREIKEILERVEAGGEASATSQSAEPEMLQEKTKEALPEKAALLPKGGEEGTPDALLDPTSEQEDAFLTETIADLYLKQGLYDQAVGIFSKMLSADSDNSHIQERLQEAILLQKGREGTATVPALEEPKEAGQDVPAAVPPAIALEEPEEKAPGNPPTELVWPESFLLSPGQGLDEGLLGGTEIDFDRFQETPAPSPHRGEPIEILNRWLEVIRQRRKLSDEPGLS